MVWRVDGGAKAVGNCVRERGDDADAGESDNIMKRADRPRESVGKIEEPREEAKLEIWKEQKRIG